jgi:DNA-binding transcriptional MerR regulator/methylmalonyl-CoA mutase cobalamin-binding subunit
MESGDASGGLRIGEMSRRLGVSDHVLRAWETRYGLLHPRRSAGGFRLYSDSDEGQVRRMQHHLASGLSAAEAARATIAEKRAISTAEDIQGSEATDDTDGVDDLAVELRRALDDFDEATAQRTLDRLLTELTLATVLRDVVLPYLHELGERWEGDQVTVAQEHFASNVIRGRLAGLARGWGSGRGPRAIVACPPGELHDLPLMIFAIILNRSGWRIDYFGMNTPIAELVQVARQVRPELVVLAATTEEHFVDSLTELQRLAELAPLAIAGVGATRPIADQLGARLLIGDPITAAEHEALRW